MKKQILTIKKKKEFIYFTVTSIVTTLPFPSFRRGVLIAVNSLFYNRNYSANSAPLSDVFRLLLSHGLTIVT